jgi:hypothetical protein
MTDELVARAFEVLDKIKDHDFRGRASYLHPRTMLTALLTHAPSKQEIAKDVIQNSHPGKLCQLTYYFWANLLVPSTLDINAVVLTQIKCGVKEENRPHRAIILPDLSKIFNGV